MTTPEPLTDSTDGLICAYALDGQGGGRPLGWADLEHVHDDLVWIHVDFTDERGRRWLTELSELDPNVIEALLSEESRPRTFEYDNGVLTVLRGVNTNPGEEVEDMVSIRIWMEPGRIISTRRRKLLSVKDIRDALESGNGPTSPGSFLADLSERLGNRIGQAVENIEEALDQAEDGHAQPGYRVLLSQFRRKTARIRRYLSPQRDALDRLSRARGDLFRSEEIAMLQEQTNRMAHFIEELDLARERAMVLQEESLANLAAEQNSRMLVLSIVAAIFLPLAFFTGLMGMNVAGLPGLNYEGAFWVVVTLMFAAAGVILGYFKWKRWL